MSKGLHESVLEAQASLHGEASSADYYFESYNHYGVHEENGSLALDQSDDIIRMERYADSRYGDGPHTAKRFVVA